MALSSFLTLITLGLLWGGVYLLAAEGLNLIYGVMRLVNLAHGDLIVLGGLLTFSLFDAHKVNPLLSFPVAAALAGLIGAAVQFGVLERIGLYRRDSELRTLLTTFGLSYVISNGSFLVWGSQFQSIPFLQDSLQAGPFALPQALVVCSAVAFCAAVLVQVWLQYTQTGKAVRAVAQSGLGAATCGLDARRIRVLTFALGCAMAGAAGALLVALIPFQPASGAEMTIQAFTLIALGGLGNYLGAFIAAELLGVIEVMAQYYLGADAATGVIYLVFIVVLIFRPQGLLGRVMRV
jgi:branched-chain amino acid transport system permease protein